MTICKWTGSVQIRERRRNRVHSALARAIKIDLLSVSDKILHVQRRFSEIDSNMSSVRDSLREAESDRYGNVFTL